MSISVALVICRKTVDDLIDDPEALAADVDLHSHLIDGGKEISNISIISWKAVFKIQCNILDY